MFAENIIYTFKFKNIIISFKHIFMLSFQKEFFSRANTHLTIVYCLANEMVLKNYNINGRLNG